MSAWDIIQPFEKVSADVVYRHLPFVEQSGLGKGPDIVSNAIILCGPLPLLERFKEHITSCPGCGATP